MVIVASANGPDPLITSTMKATSPAQWKIAVPPAPVALPLEALDGASVTRVAAVVASTAVSFPVLGLGMRMGVVRSERRRIGQHHSWARSGRPVGVPETNDAVFSPTFGPGPY